MYWNNVETKPGAGYPATGRSWAAAGGRRGSPERPANSRRRRTTVVRGTSTTRRSCTRGATSRSAPWRTPTGGRTGTRTRVPASTPTPTTSTSPDLQPLYAPLLRRGVPALGDLQARGGRDRPRRSGPAAAATGTASRGVPTRRCSTTHRRRPARSASSVTPGSKEKGRRARCGPRPAPRTARRSSGTSASSTTRTVRFTSSSTSTRSPYGSTPSTGPSRTSTIPAVRAATDLRERRDGGRQPDSAQLPGRAFGPEVESALNTITREREKAERGEESELMEILSTVNNDDQYRLEVFDDDG